MVSDPFFPLPVNNENLTAHCHVAARQSLGPGSTEGDDSSTIRKGIVELLLDSGLSVCGGPCICQTENTDLGRVHEVCNSVCS